MIRFSELFRECFSLGVAFSSSEWIVSAQVEYRVDTIGEGPVNCRHLVLMAGLHGRFGELGCLFPPLKALVQVLNLGDFSPSRHADL